MDNEVLRILLARGPRCEVPRCFLGKYVEITLGMAAFFGFSDWSKYDPKYQHHIRYYHNA